MNSVSTAIKPEPICRVQNPASVSVSVITVIVDAIHRKLASGNRRSQFYCRQLRLVVGLAPTLTTTGVPCRVPAPRNGISPMHAYRTHTCGALRLADSGRTARLSGWVHRKRDHGQLLFVDLRDHYGLTQCVIDVSSPLFAVADALRLESVVTLTGQVTARST